MELAVQKIEETLYTVGFIAKKVTNSEEVTDRIQISVNRSISKFPNKFSKYLMMKCALVN